MCYVHKREKGVRRINRFISRLYLALFDAESGRPLNEFSCALYTPVDYSVVVDKSSLSACKLVEGNPHTILHLCVVSLYLAGKPAKVFILYSSR